MNIFKLPDLGEGLPEAEIHEWFVKEGDTVSIDQPLVSMETAKAVVDVPSPEAGVVSKLFGKPGDIIKTGEPLIAFDSSAFKADKGTVVGHLEENFAPTEDHFSFKEQGLSSGIKISASNKILAKKLGVDLLSLQGTGVDGLIRREDILKLAEKKKQAPEGFEPLRGVRRAMLSSMIQSHQEVVPVSIFDEVDINHWKPNTDITVRLIQALVQAATIEPALNAWFDTQSASRNCFKPVHLGLAMDNAEGLFVPVLHDVGQYSEQSLRQQIDALKIAVAERTIPADQLKGATITLSNFGKFAGRFASPIIVPPMVAILAVGRLYQAAVPIQDKIEIRRMLPLSLSFDHRAVTGGEATRFLGAVMKCLALE